jgi:2-keto-4-pentenoate hydratase/2-oxohepta-3-ene-1,7-dioic acid hydratase in catechol pathway
LRLASFSQGGMSRVGIVTDRGIIDVKKHFAECPSQMIHVIEEWQRLHSKFGQVATEQADYTLAEVTLLAPVAKPEKVLCIGLNYADHCAEAGLEPPKSQLWFSKVPSSVTGPYDDIELPVVSDQLDYEAEMVMVVGKRCRNVPKADAASVIFGYCVGNDVSVRDWQLKTSQFFIGKAFDTHAPFGPWITTPDEVDPHTLNISCSVNGQLRQNSNTRNLIFDCYDQIALLSQVMTLVPGDIVFTGTPGGVGAAMKPPAFMKDSDRVRVEIEKLGSIEGRIKRGSAAVRIG